MLMILVHWILRKTPNRLLQYHLGVQLHLCIFEIEVPAPNSWDDRDLSVTQNELSCLLSLLQRSPLFCFWPSSAAIPVFSPIFPIISPLLLLHPVFFNAWGIGINLCSKLYWLSESIPFAAMWSSWYLHGTPSNRSLTDSSASTNKHFWSCFSQYCRRFPRGRSLVFYKELLLASEFPIFCEPFSWYVWILHHQVQWRRQSIFALLCVSMHQTYASTYLAIHCRVLRSFVSSSVSAQTMYIRQVSFHSIKWILWNPSMHLTILFLHPRSSNHQCVSPTSHLKFYR